MLDTVGLVHMNERVYDAELGRFISADPYIQYSDNPQSFNRYSYVQNNPLSSTDPSGFFIGKLFKAIANVFKSVVKAVASAIEFLYTNPIVQQLRVIGAAIACAPAGLSAQCAAGASALNTAINGGSIGDVFKSAAITFASTQAFGAIGGSKIDGVQKIIAHGVVGGTFQELSGGSFVSGFLSAGFVQAAGQGLNFFGITDAPTDFSGYAANAAVSAVIGGTASVLGGGKFGNGAVTGAFSRLFNDMNHGPQRAREWQERLAARARVVERFMDFVRANGVERGPNDNIIVEIVAWRLGDLPAAIRDFEPGSNVYGRIVDDIGDYMWNQRLPGGYHLTVDAVNGPVNLHFDAYNILNGPIDNYRHWYHEVRRINNGELRVLKAENNFENWR